MAPIPGKGPTWLTRLVSLPDEEGTRRLVATYVKIEGFLDVYELGLCTWNGQTHAFEPLKRVWKRTTNNPTPPFASEGHPTLWTDDAGKRWLLIGDPFPSLRIPATFEALQDLSRWEKLDPQLRVARAGDGKMVVPHRGSIAWSAFRERWVAVFTEKGGTPSPLGEIWYAEADQPTGPWGDALKVLSHENYSFYNPRIHADLTPEGSPILLFEGTYTAMFSNARSKTPRYDYNQILYRLDLDDPKLKPAQVE